MTQRIFGSCALKVMCFIAAVHVYRYEFGKLQFCARSAEYNATQ
jgi:hypothetical protein